MSTPPLARRERHALCDLALTLGPDAPTLCGDWSSTDLVAHLHVREKRPLASLGIVLPPLSGLTDRAMARAARRDYAVLVERVRAPGLTPFALRPVDVLANTLEYAVHHEDLRRARARWEPRVLEDADRAALWRALRLTGKQLGRAAGVPLEVRPTDVLRRGQPVAAVLAAGEDPVVLSGPVLEIVLFLFGRRQLRSLEVTGPPDAVATVRGADLGL